MANLHYLFHSIWDHNLHVVHGLEITKFRAGMEMYYAANTKTKKQDFKIPFFPLI